MYSEEDKLNYTTLLPNIQEKEALGAQSFPMIFTFSNNVYAGTLRCSGKDGNEKNGYRDL